MKAPTIDEYIERKAQDLSAKDLAQLPALLERCRAKAQRVPTDRHPRLASQITLLAKLLESLPSLAADRPGVDPWRELAVGAFYVVKGVDCIPDSVPDIGFTDDARLLDRIFARNRTAILRAAERRNLAESLTSAMP